MTASHFVECKKANDFTTEQRIQAFKQKDQLQIDYIVNPEFFYTESRLADHRKDVSNAVLSIHAIAPKRRSDEENILLGFGYESGMGVIEDAKEAVRLYRTSSSATAKYMLGRICEKEKEFKHAEDYYSQAANLQLPAAMHRLSIAVRAQKKRFKAAELLQKAAEFQHPQAMLELATEFAYDENTRREAVQYFQLAAKNGIWIGLAAAIFWSKPNPLLTKTERKETLHFAKFAEECVNVYAHYHLAKIYEAFAHNVERAALSFRVCIEKLPGLIPSENFLAFIQKSGNDNFVLQYHYAAAVKDSNLFSKLAELQPDEFDKLFNKEKNWREMLPLLDNEFYKLEKIMLDLFTPAILSTDVIKLISQYAITVQPQRTTSLLRAFSFMSSSQSFNAESNVSRQFRLR